MKVYIHREKSQFCLPNNSLDEKCPKTTFAILRCTIAFSRLVYMHMCLNVHKYIYLFVCCELIEETGRFSNVIFGI